MAIQGVDTKCYILALFVRDDGERFLLGSGHYEFKDTQMHFAANAIQNDIVEVQGNDGFLLAGQVRRPGTQSFDGYVGDGTLSKQDTEAYRRQFFSFFRKNFFYKVIYVFSDGTAIQRKRGFLVDDPTVQELYQIYPEYHVALNFEDVNYYSYSEDDEGHEQYAKEATIDLSSMRATGGLVWDNLGVVWEDTQWGGEQTASGTEMIIQNEMDVPSIVDDIRLDGDTEQETYSGANLYNYTDMGATPGLGITTDSDGWITCTVDNSAGTSTRYSNYYTKPLALSPSTQYALVMEVLSVSGTGGIEGGGGSSASQVAYFGISFSNMTSGGTYILPITSKSNVSGEYGLRMYFRFNAGQSGSISVRISVLADTSVTQETFVYQPFTGSIPAPNPDYPQAVQTATGEQTVTVSGKNLWDTSNVIDGVGLDGSTGQMYPATNRSTLDYTSLSPDTTYTLSGCSMKSICFYDSNKTFISRSVQYTATSPSGTSYARIAFDNTVEHSKIQLEEGSTATAYEQYRSQAYTLDLGSTELCKLGDYQDYIYKGADGWYLHKEVDSIDLYGKRVTSTTFSDLQFYYMTGYDAIDVMCTHFTGVADDRITANGTAYTYMNDGQCAFRGGTSKDRVYFKTSKFASSADMTTWLASNHMLLYYIIATPTDTQITDSTLIGQLNALGAMKLFIGENNLAIQATETNLPAPLSFKYYTTVAMTGAEWEEGGSGGATVVEVDSITNTYPIWRVKGPAVDPQLSVINTNTTIRYTGTVTSTQTLEIDMFNKTAKLNGVSVIGNVSGDWVSLAPGTNRVIYTAENAEAQPSIIEWQEVVG